MSPERWKRVDRLFQEAVTLAPGQQEAWLDQACSGDEDLLNEVRDMLAADAGEGGLQDQVRAAASEFAQAATQTVPVRRAGPYRLTRELGRGGMGTVYLGERDDGQYDAEVAVKLIRAGMDTAFFYERFKRERQALARLQHPNIARIFDSGATDDGRPYIVMELVRGVPITTYAAEKNLSVDRILSLYLEVCSAVSHAHEKFVVHRDLKPGNILAQQDGAPKLLDFGICKLIEDAAPGAETLTGAHLMTPEYASPEQMRGQTITASSDIYSLGAVLYELLTGRPPHIIARASPAAMVAVCEEEVPAPSRMAKDPAKGAEIAGLLDTVVLRALHKDLDRRYRTVDRLAEDLRRVLNREAALAPTDQGPPALRRGVPSRRLLAGAVAALLLAAAGWVWWQRSEARARKTQSAAVRERAQQLWDLQTRASVTEARSLAEAAVGLDPDNGPAHIVLAEIYNSMIMWFGAEDQKDLADKVRTEARTAIRLMPKSESAWRTWIAVSLGKSVDLPNGLQACREGLAVLPQSVAILATCSRMQTLAGNSEIALMLARQLEDAKPDGPEKWMQLANSYFRLGRAEESRANCAKVIAVQPKRLACLLILAYFTTAAGQPKQALAMLRTMDTVENRKLAYFVWALIFMAAKSGDEASVAELLGRAKHIRPERFTAAAELAARMGRGQFEKALDLLEAGVAEREYFALEMMSNSVLSKELVGNPRYEKLLERLRGTQAAK